MKLDKFKSIFNVNKKILVFLIGLFIIALIFGSSLPLFLSDSDKVLVSEYLNNFIGNIDNNNYIISFFNGLLTNCCYGLLIWLLGISVIGVPIVLFMFFSKCFILGFSVSSIIVNYKIKGVLFSLVYIFPHQVINIIVYGLLTVYSIIFSLRILFLLFKKNDFNINLAFNRYFKIFILLFLLLLISTLYEIFLSPVILKLVFDLLGL